MKIDPRNEVIPTLEMYSRLALRVAGEAHALYLETNALHLQIDATIANMIRAARKEPSRLRRFWNRMVR